MTTYDIKPISGTIFDDTTEITIVELCEVCSVERTMVYQMIDEGILEPTSRSGKRQQFPYSSVRRTRTVVHLQRDRGVNLAGAALVLDLLERIDEQSRR